MNTETLQSKELQGSGGVRKPFRDLAKRVIPRAWVMGFRQYRRFSKAERNVYLSIRVANVFRGRESFGVPRSARSLIFVCFGNIMRSPMCEALFRRAIVQFHELGGRDRFQIMSAGLNAVAGKRAHPWAISAARNFGLFLETHRAVGLTQDMVDRADVLFAMDYQNVVQLTTRYPAAARKVFLLGAYASQRSRPVEIHDPFFGSEEETARCYRLIEVCTQNLAAHLHGPQSNSEKSTAQPELMGARI